MEINDIKQRLTIHQVLQHYSLAPDKTHRLKCPFHNDKTPSMQVYPETDTVFCFSSKCKLSGKAIDQIDFIMHKENCTKHEAINKAKELSGVFPVSRSTQNIKQMINNTESHIPDSEQIDRIAVLAKLMYEAKESLQRSLKALGYCKQRGLDYNKTEVGFLAERFYNSWTEKLKQTAIEVGLLKNNANGSLSPVFRNCIIFPVKNKQGQIISIYGRSITDKKDQKHYYLKGKHQGIYPKYPNPATTKLIITESIIDTATLLQIEAITTQYSTLSLYGTNGLTEEHSEAIKQLKELQEVIFMLDADEAGNKAVEKYAEQLRMMNEQLRISKIELPENEDINSVYLAHDPEIFLHFLNERFFLFSNEKSIEKIKEPIEPINTSTNQHINILDTSNHDKIIYDTELLKIEIWGGVEYNNLHRLRLSLHLENKTTNRSFRDDVNLYSNRSSKAFIEDASEELEISQSDLKQLIEEFTKEAEAYRMKQKAHQKASGRPQIVHLSMKEQEEALKLLKDKCITKHLRGAMQKAGLIGETDNGLLLFLIFLTRFFDTPLHALVHGSTGSGKTNLLKTILKLVPEESKYETTALTENVLFRPPYKEFWKNKILLIEDLDGSYKALLPLREFMSNQKISKLSADPNIKTGKHEQVTLEASGPIVIAGATTKDHVYEDNSNRSFLLHVDESKSHQDAILDYQNRQAAGLIDKDGIEVTCHKIHNMQRMLNQHIKIINPFQPQLKLPEYIFRKLRTNTHYITLIQAVTFLHQCQREKKKNDRGHIFIETTLEDVELANNLSKHSLLRKSDELGGQVREFFEHLKAVVKQNSKEIFLAKDMRRKLRMHPMKFSRYINELRNRGYVKQTGGNFKTSYEYQIIVWDDYQILKDGLNIMDEILEKLWKSYPDGKYSKNNETEIIKHLC